MAEELPTRPFCVWIITPINQRESLSEDVVSKLVRRGFTVGPLGGSLVTSHDDRPAAVISLSVYRVPRTQEERNEYNATGMYHEVCDVLKVVKARFLAIVISSPTQGSSWNYGNISIEKELKAQEEANKKVN
jgi:hypothetical protein